MAKTAGIVIIGDEETYRQGAGLQFLLHGTGTLVSYGIQLCHISIIADIIGEIADEVKTLSDKFDFVLTSGGIWTDP